MNDPSITDWISAGAAVVGALTALVTAFLAYTQYLKPPEQEAEPPAPEAPAGQASDDNRSLTVFATSKQTTVLRASAIGLECHLLDQREGRGGHQWTLGPDQLRTILETGDYRVDPNYRAATGKFSVGPRRGWLYSKKLFPEPEYLHGGLAHIIEKALEAATK